MQSDTSTSEQVRTPHTLYCTGPPGAGKTILSSAVIQDLYSRFQSDPDSNVGVAYLYLDVWFQEEQSTQDLLLSLLRQLLWSRPELPPMTGRIKRTHYEMYTQPRDCPRSRPSRIDVINAINEVVAAYTRVFLVVDALDASEPGQRAGLLKEIFTLQAGEVPVHLFVTSGSSPEIVTWFSSAVSLEIRADD